MESQIMGFYFKRVLGGLLGTEVLFPELTKRLGEMSDDGWYDWEEYKRLLKAVADKLGPTAVSAVGWRIVTQAASVFKQQGFTTPESILKDFLLLVRANIKNPLLDEVPVTVFFEPGHAIIEAGTAQPMALVQGQLYGIVQMFGGVVLSLDAKEVQRESGPGYRWDVRWT